MCVKFGPTTPFVGVGLSENFDLGCVEKLLCRRGLGSPFCLLTDEESFDDTGDDECEESDTCVGGDFGLKCGLENEITVLRSKKYHNHPQKINHSNPRPSGF